ncbi:3-methyl-2-oxobutanoate hydroxymethyltransferase [Ectothiorhodospiraceae bacterium WFHF3C12]|nr:3-methyl-2-oxobutanoate hydroxymethyltransferase [Ectothiorhodospiraceae bacterium WFHF3C12]
MIEQTVRRKKVTPSAIQRRKWKGVPITVVSAYDYPVAKWADEAGIDIIFVSDALAMVGLGRDNVFSVSVDEMVYHTKAVCSGSGKSLVLTAMPLLSYRDPEQALLNAGRLIQEGGAHAVEIEGGKENVPVIEALTAQGIPVLAHIGLSKKDALAKGEYRIKGRAPGDAMHVIEEARAVERAGAFAVAMECVTDRIAETVTKIVSVPTIGIGSGKYCDGQALVTQDMLGMFDKFCPRFVRRYAEISALAVDSLTEFRRDVEGGAFPQTEHSTQMNEDTLRRLLETKGVDEELLEESTPKGRRGKRREKALSGYVDALVKQLDQAG